MIYLVSRNKSPDKEKLNRIVARSRLESEKRGHSYREQALKLFPWICGHCAREFTRGNLQELTVHHKDHNHDNNPPDGSNWELLCLYCHDNEHQRYLENSGNVGSGEQISKVSSTTYKPFAKLKSILKEKK